MGEHDFSPKAKNAAARLMAVQALYQSRQNEQGLEDVTREFLSTRVGMEIDGEKMVSPDGALFKNILEAVQERRSDLERIITENLTKDNKDLDLILQAILLCGGAELLAHPEVDAGIIINDYVNVAHSFYDSGQPGLVNAVLDSIRGAVRDE